MGLATDIAGWNGRSAGDIEAIYLRHRDAARFTGSLIACLREPATQKGAGWLLKRHLEAGADVSAAQRRRIFALLPDLGHWESRLHLLQSLPRLPIAASDVPGVEDFVRDCLTSEKVFVRAWAYNGMYELARRFPRYREEAEAFFELAMRDEPASVKARIRNLRKRGWSSPR